MTERLFVSSVQKEFAEERRIIRDFIQRDPQQSTEVPPDHGWPGFSRQSPERGDIMNTADIIIALDLPASARVDQLIPRKLLLENGAPTSADKRYITECIEELLWKEVRPEAYRAYESALEGILPTTPLSF